MTASENLKGCMAFMVVKAPIPGKVKSRLAGTVGDEKAAEIYRKLVLEEVKVLRDPKIPLTVLYHPMGMESAIRDMVGSGLVLKPQRGEDLGERLQNGFLDLFEYGFDRVVALSSDVPELTKGTVLEAFASLDDNDAVIGPCPDGGYYLIGFRTLTFRPEALTRVDMGTDRTASETLEALKGLKVKILPELSDIDTLEDLKEFNERRRENLYGESDL